MKLSNDLSTQGRGRGGAGGFDRAHLVMTKKTTYIICSYSVVSSVLEAAVGVGVNKGPLGVKNGRYRKATIKNLAFQFVPIVSL